MSKGGAVHTLYIPAFVAQSCLFPPRILLEYSSNTLLCLARAVVFPSLSNHHKYKLYGVFFLFVFSQLCCVAVAL